MADLSEHAFHRFETRVSARIKQMETTLIQEFRTWAVPVQAKQRVFEA